MKKLIYLGLPLLITALYSCNPLDDTYNQLDKNAPAHAGLLVQKDVTIKLTNPDYELLKGSTATGAANAAKYHDFSSNDEAKALVPLILLKKYPLAAKNSSAVVTYDVYNSVGYKHVTPYTLTVDDYTTAGGNIAKYKDLSSDADIEKMATLVAPKVFPGIDLTDGYTIALTYDIYKGGIVTTTSNVIYWGGVWHAPYVLTSSDYTAMQQKYNDFNDQTVAVSYISTYMNIKFPYGNKAGDIKAITYAYYSSGSNTDVLLLFKNDGTKWNLLSNVQDFTLQFGFNGTVWEADNTIKYTCTTDDYKAMALDPAISSGQQSSLASYYDFDLALSTQDEINTVIGNRLLVLFPNAKEGQKYLVTYATYHPAGSASTHLILTNGKYVPVQ